MLSTHRIPPTRPILLIHPIPLIHPVHIEMGLIEPSDSEKSAVTFFDRSVFSQDVILKACYWLSNNFSCEIASPSPEVFKVTITPRQKSSIAELSAAKERLIQEVSDFALREKIEAKTASIRDLLLAKAFSEAGVLEDIPTGVFGDRIEEEKPHGIFKILSNSDS